MRDGPLRYAGPSASGMVSRGAVRPAEGRTARRPGGALGRSGRDGWRTPGSPPLPTGGRDTHRVWSTLWGGDPGDARRHPEPALVMKVVPSFPDRDLAEGNRAGTPWVAGPVFLTYSEAGNKVV